MWKVFIAVILFMSLVTGLDKNSSARLESQEASPGAAVELTLLKRTATRIELQVTVCNTGENPVLVVTDPVRLDGSEGAYLSLNKNNSSQLELAFAIYPPPFYTRLAPKTRVIFRKLDAGETYQTNVVLESALKETKPPWGETFDSRTIDLAKIQHIRASVGILPDDPGIISALSNVRSSEGSELVASGPLKGKALFQLQHLISSNAIKL